ncbi:ATP-binding protein, partial [Candidatus Eisenbacteria bacterium]
RELEERHVVLCEMSDAEPEDLHKRQVELERRVTAAKDEQEQLQSERETLRSRVANATAEGTRVGNVAILEREITALEEEEARLLLERDAIRTAFETLREADQRFSQTHRLRLEQHASDSLRHLTNNSRRSVQLGDRYEIRISEEGGQPCSTRQLSQGARDQLALALRLAVADLLSGGRRPPLFFDDPFLSFDLGRLEAVRVTLEKLAALHQVVILSHRPGLAPWGHPVGVDQ